MATPIRIKRSAVSGKKPTANQLLSAELGYNTYDGELYAKRERPGIGTDVIRIGAGATVTNVLYVTKDGSDTNTGRKLGDAKATIGAALSESTTGTVIRISAGYYIENNPLIIPEQVSIVGDSLREVSISPQNSDQDLFYVSNGNYIAEMSYTGSLDLGKAIFAFNPENIGYFNQSPYIQNCTNFIPNSIGMKIDGSKAIGPLKSMVLDSYTQYNQGGIGVSITNEGYAQLVSLFTICDDIAVYCGSGAACDLTNSNSSFGNYGLVADGIGPKKYTGIVTNSSEENAFEFVLNLNTPTLSIVSATYDNVTGILTANTNNPHGFSVGMGVSLSGLAFTCTYEPGTLIYPSGNKGYVFETVTVAPGRYFDSYNLIQANKQEIQDKSLASIALNHPDFYFPGDFQTNSRSRYYDSYRLIQKNKEIIVDTAWSNTFSVYPGISTTITKCKRDLGYFVDAISTDVFTGGNKYSRDFVLQYFNNGVPISNGLVGEEVKSNYAFVQARDLMKQAITNTLVGAVYTDLTITADPLTGSNTSPSSCADVRSNIDNLVGIVTTVIDTGYLSFLPVENSGSFTDGGSKCYRDIGYIIDAVSLDVRDYTSANSIEATRSYFNINGNPITNGLVGEETETITAFNSVRDYMKLAITNQLNTKDLTLPPDPLTGFNNNPSSCSDVQSFIDNLVGIITTRIGAGNINGVNALPAVSSASTTFSVYVGTSTLPHTYSYGGVVKIDVVRPFDGQVIYLDRLYYTIGDVMVSSGGSGYTGTVEVIIENPETDWGIAATAVAEVKNGSVISVEMISNGRGYTKSPKVTFSSPTVGINTAYGVVKLIPSYYVIEKSTPISSGICTITLNENVPYAVGVGTQVPFYKQSRVLASGHSLEYIGSGTDINAALPKNGGVPIQENETDARNGGLVVFTSTDQSGNFRIGDGVVVNQTTGTISGTFYSKSLFSTLTPFILALGGE
jgi:hypothetical protein